MRAEIGKVYEGIVQTITKYGAFVEVKEDGKRPWTGMVHISELSHKYIKDISDMLSVGQPVQIMVIGTNNEGKISLSMKQLEGPPTPKPGIPRPPLPEDVAPPHECPPIQGTRRERNAQENFEDMLSQFKKNSDERIQDINHITQRKTCS